MEIQLGKCIPVRLSKILLSEGEAERKSRFNGAVERFKAAFIPISATRLQHL